MLIVTQNSTYEIDAANSRIRRLEGVNNPTPRQGQDGDWRTYLAISDVTVGEIVLVTWQIVEGVAKATYLSPVQQIVTIH